MSDVRHGALLRNTNSVASSKRQTLFSSLCYVNPAMLSFVSHGDASIGACGSAMHLHLWAHVHERQHKQHSATRQNKLLTA